LGEEGEDGYAGVASNYRDVHFGDIQIILLGVKRLRSDL